LKLRCALMEYHFEPKIINKIKFIEMFSNGDKRESVLTELGLGKKLEKKDEEK